MNILTVASKNSRINNHELKKMKSDIKNSAILQVNVQEKIKKVVDGVPSTSQ